MRLLFFVLAVHGSAAVGLAQKPGIIPNEDPDSTTRWLILAGIVVVVAITAFLNPKRSHLN